jgi:hypothetical protein
MIFGLSFCQAFSLPFAIKEKACPCGYDNKKSLGNKALFVCVWD